MNNDFNQNNQNGQQGNFYNPNGQQQGNFYNPNGQGNFYNPNMPNMNQLEATKKANNAKTFGLIALITSFICTGVIPIVLGILAIVNASSAKSLIGYDIPEAKSGRTMGIASLIITGVACVLVIALYVVLFALVMTGALY